jgi:hypothetical protein
MDMVIHGSEVCQMARRVPEGGLVLVTTAGNLELDEEALRLIRHAPLHDPDQCAVCRAEERHRRATERASERPHSAALVSRRVSL